MFDLKIVENYSCALFKLAQKQSNEEVVLSQIQFFSKLMNGSDSIKEALCSPVIDKAVKIKLVDFVDSKYNLEKISKSFLYSLIKNSRILLLPDMVRKFQDLILEKNGIKLAEIISASKIDQKTIDNVRKMLEAKLKKTIQLKTTIDPNLMGGIVIKYDSNLIDASISGALSKIDQIAAKAKI